MANVASVVANIAIRATTDGVPEATASLKGLAAAQDNVAVISESSAKRQATATAAYNKQSIALDSTIKSMDRIAKATTVADRALSQGLITQTEHAARLDLINSKYGVATDGTTRFGTALKAANDNVAGFSSQLGTVGTVLSALGPIGVAVAVALAVMTLGFKQASDAALKLADDAGKLGDTADTIGTTVENLRALQLIGGEVGVESEKLNTGLEKFSSVLGQVRDGAQGATDSFNNLKPGLADNVRNAKTFDEALQLVFSGLKNADTAAASLASRELFGKGGAGFARIAGAVDDVTKLGNSLNAIDVITTKQAKTWDQLGDSIGKNMKLAGTNVTASFAEPVLKILDDVSKIVVELSRTFRLLVEPIAQGFSISGLEDFRAELQTINSEIKNFGTSVAVSNLAERLFGTDFVSQASVIITQIKAIADVLIALISILGSARDAMTAAFTFNPAGLLAAAEKAKSAYQTIGNAASTAFSAEFSGRVDSFAKRFDALSGAAGTGTKEWFKFANQMEEIGGIVGDSLPPKFGKAGSAAGDAGKKALDFVDIMHNNVSALGGAATAAEKYQDQVGQLAKKLQEGTINQDTFNRAVAHLEPNMVALRGVVSDLGSALSQAFIKGQNKAEALNNSLKSISATASSKAINSLLTGDFASAGLQGAIGLGAGLLSKLFGGGDDGKEQQAQQAAAEKAEQARLAREQQIAEAQIRAADYSLRVANAMEKSGFIVQIRQFDAESQRAFDEESKRAGDIAIWQLVAARAAERTKLIADTIEEATNTLAGNELSEVQSRLKEIAEAADTLGKALIETGIGAEAAADAVTDKLNPALDKLKGDFIDDLNRKLNELAGGSWINDLDDLIKQVNQLRSDASALGLDAGDKITEFLARSAQKIIDSAQLTGSAFDAIVRATGLAGSSLHEFGAAIADVAAVAKRSAQEIASTIQSNTNALFELQHASGSLTDQLAVFNLHAQQAIEAEKAAGGEALVSLVALQEAQKLKIVQDYNAQQLQAQLDAQKAAADAAQQAADAALKAQQQAAEDQQRAVEEATKFLTGALQNIANFIQHFLAGSQSPLSPAAALASAQSSFSTQKALALGGNRDALSGITGNAQDVIDAATAYYGSSAAGQAIITGIINDLQTLPAQVSVEKFIVDGLTTPINTSATMVSSAITTQTSTLQSSLNNIVTAANSGSAAQISAALLPVFNSIDTNTDQAISFSEMQSALGNDLPSGKLSQIFTTLDTDGDGQISRLELIKTATQGTQTATGTVVTNTGTSGALAIGVNNVDTNTDKLGPIDTSTANAATSLLALAQISGNTQNTAADTAQANNLLTPIRSMLIQQNANWGATGYSGVTVGAAVGSPPIPQFALGGLVDGSSHSGGGVNINAEGGEYIMSRSAVSRIGVPTLHAMNFNSSASNDNLVSEIRSQTKAIMTGMRALVSAEFESAGMVSSRIAENDKSAKRRRFQKAA